MVHDNFINYSSYTLQDYSQHFGKYGRFQIQILIAICFIVTLNESFGLSYVFTAGHVNYRCQIPACESNFIGDYNPSWINIAIPVEDDKPKSCVRYKFLNLTNDNKCNEVNFDQNIEEDCDKIFFEDYEKTIANDVYIRNMIYSRLKQSNINQFSICFSLI